MRVPHLHITVQKFLCCSKFKNGQAQDPVSPVWACGDGGESDEEASHSEDHDTTADPRVEVPH